MFILNWLKKPYYFEKNPKFHLYLSIAIGSFIFLFIYAFKPFGVSKVKNNIFLYSLGFGAVTFGVQSFIFIIVPFIFKDFFKSDQWTIGKNIFILLVLINVISICNWFYNSHVQISDNGYILSLKDIFTYTFSIAIFPIFLYTYFSEKVNRNKREKISKDIMSFKVNDISEETNEEIIILGENQKESITFKIDDLIYITSLGNYVSFYIYINEKIEEKILRNTLTKVVLHLKNKTNIIRCHRSYIVNSNYMNSISGNARGYFLESKLLSKQIPVSRSFKKEELKNLIH